MSELSFQKSSDGGGWMGGRDGWMGGWGVLVVCSIHFLFYFFGLF